MLLLIFFLYILEEIHDVILKSAWSLFNTVAVSFYLFALICLLSAAASSYFGVGANNCEL